MSKAKLKWTLYLSSTPGVSTVYHVVSDADAIALIREAIERGMHVIRFDPWVKEDEAGRVEHHAACGCASCGDTGESPEGGT